MNIPNYDNVQMVDKEGYPTSSYSNFMQTLLKGFTECISNEGYLIPSVSSEPGSAAPPAGADQLSNLQNSYQSTIVNPDTQTVTVGVQVGTIIFDPWEINGGSGMTPRLGQLKVLLNDGTFHAIVNL